MAKQVIQHGVLLNIYDIGVLITGPSNIGKSELALSLLERGHRLIADDHIVLVKENGSILGACPTTLQGFLAIRDLGILNIIKIFGQQAISSQKRLELIINLTSNHEYQTISTEAVHLQGVITMQNILGIKIPQQTILVKPQRNLALLTEISVRSYQLRDAGYNACADLIAKQQQFFNDIS